MKVFGSDLGIEPQVDVTREDGAPLPSLSVADTIRADRIKHRLMIADAVSLLTGAVLAFGFHLLLKSPSTTTMWKHGLLITGSIPFFAVGAGMNHLYRSRSNERWMEEACNVVRAVIVGIAGLLVLAFCVQYKELSRLWVTLLGAFGVLTVLVERKVARAVFARLRASGVICRRIVIVGTDPHAVGLMDVYRSNPMLGYEVVGFVGDSGGAVPLLGPICNLHTIMRDCGAVGVVVSLSSVGAAEVNFVAREMTEGGFHVALSSGLLDIDVTRLRAQELDGRSMFYVERVVRGGWRAAAKRVFDLSLALLLILITAPILIVAMIAVRFDSPGPIFFRQTRVGKNGEHFLLVKLRTMVVDADLQKVSLAALNEASGALFKIKDDPRLTRVGRLLRRMSIDELPQLTCVLRGTMSMVGPRPALPEEVAQWDEKLAERLRVLPGLTGLWQVSGRSDSSFESYKRLDLYYVDNWSLRHDAAICAKTIRVVMSGRGAA